MRQIQIPKSLIAHYLGRFADDLSLGQSRDIYDQDFIDECFQAVKQELIKFDEQTLLASGLKHLIDKVAVEQYMDYSSQEESLTDDVMEHIVKILYKKTRPFNYEDSLSTEITSESLDEFRIRRGVYYKTAKGETLESVALKFSIPTSSILESNPFLARKFQASGELPEGTTFSLNTQRSTWTPVSN